MFSTFLNTLFRVSFRLNHPFCCGVCQVVRSTSFREVNGYDRQQVHGEDSALFQQLARIGKIRFLSDQMIYESPRRYRKFGYFRLIKTALFSILGQKILKRNVLKSWERVD